MMKDNDTLLHLIHRLNQTLKELQKLGILKSLVNQSSIHLLQSPSSISPLPFSPSGANFFTFPAFRFNKCHDTHYCRKTNCAGFLFSSTHDFAVSRPLPRPSLPFSSMSLTSKEPFFSVSGPVSGAASAGAPVSIARLAGSGALSMLIAEGALGS